MRSVTAPKADDRVLPSTLPGSDGPSCHDADMAGSPAVAAAATAVAGAVTGQPVPRTDEAEIAVPVVSAAPMVQTTAGVGGAEAEQPVAGEKEESAAEVAGGPVGAVSEEAMVVSEQPEAVSEQPEAPSEDDDADMSSRTAVDGDSALDSLAPDATAAAAVLPEASQDATSLRSDVSVEPPAAAAAAAAVAVAPDSDGSLPTAVSGGEYASVPPETRSTTPGVADASSSSAPSPSSPVGVAAVHGTDEDDAAVPPVTCEEVSGAAAVPSVGGGVSSVDASGESIYTWCFLLFVRSRVESSSRARRGAGGDSASRCCGSRLCRSTVRVAGQRSRTVRRSFLVCLPLLGSLSALLALLSPHVFVFLFLFLPPYFFHASTPKQMYRMMSTSPRCLPPRSTKQQRQATNMP